jgi:ankyrin repeat protein
MKIFIAIILLLVFQACGLTTSTREVNTKNAIQYTKSGNLESLKQLIARDKSLANSQRSDGASLLYLSAEYRHPRIASLLISHGANLNATNANGGPLHAATQMEDLEVINLLIKAGANINLRSSHFHATPLHSTRWNKSSTAANLLLSNGANVNLVDSMGKNPLHSCENYEVIKLLIHHGANVEKKDNKGYTPLHWFATRRQSVEADAIEFLLNNSNNLSAQDNEGLTPLHLAVKNKKVEFIAILQKPPR